MDDDNSGVTFDGNRFLLNGAPIYVNDPEFFQKVFIPFLQHLTYGLDWYASAKVADHLLEAIYNV